MRVHGGHGTLTPGEILELSVGFQAFEEGFLQRLDAVLLIGEGKVKVFCFGIGSKRLFKERLDGFVMGDRS